eukprot:3924809-Rhodomonas_salina.1
MQGCLCTLCAHWGFSNVEEDGCAVLGWQCANQCWRDLVASAPRLVQGLQSVPPLQKALAHNTKQPYLREIFRRVMPK